MPRLRHHRPGRFRARHFQFSIGRLLVLTAVCAVLLPLDLGPVLGVPFECCLVVLLLILLFADWSERHIAAGSQALATGRYRLAVERFSRAVQADPDDPLRHCYRAAAHSWDNDWEAAFTDYSRAIALDSRCQPAWSGRAMVAVARGDYQQAIDDATVALCLNPDDADTLMARAYAYTILGPFQAAIEDFSAAIRLDPRNAQIHWARGSVHLIVGEYTKALDDLRAAMHLGATVAAVNETLVRFKLGDHRAAIQAIEEYRRQQPASADALNAHSWFLATCPDDALRDGRRALELAEEASRLHGGNDWPCDEYLAAALAEVGRFDEAVAHAESAFREAPPLWRARLQSRLAVLQEGRPLRDRGEAVIDAPFRAPQHEPGDGNSPGESQADRHATAPPLAEEPDHLPPLAP